MSGSVVPVRISWVQKRDYCLSAVNSSVCIKGAWDTILV